MLIAAAIAGNLCDDVHVRSETVCVGLLGAPGPGVRLIDAYDFRKLGTLYTLHTLHTIYTLYTLYTLHTQCFRVIHATYVIYAIHTTYAML